MPRYVIAEVEEGGANFKLCLSLHEVDEYLMSWSKLAQKCFPKIQEDIQLTLLASIKKLEVGEFGSYPCGMVFRVVDGTLEQPLIDLEEMAKCS